MSALRLRSRGSSTPLFRSTVSARVGIGSVLRASHLPNRQRRSNSTNTSTSAANASSYAESPLQAVLAKESLQARLKKDNAKATVLRSVIGDLQTELKKTTIHTPEKEEELSLKVLRRAVSQRQEAAAKYRSMGYIELAENEEKEVQMITSLLPPQLSKEEVVVNVTLLYEELKGANAFRDVSAPPRAIDIIVSAFQTKFGKRSAPTGDIKAALMPLLTKDGLLQKSKKK